MKKIIFYVICSILLITSCSPVYNLTTTETIGDVSVISPTGETLKTWTDVSIDKTVVSEQVNSYSPYTGKPYSGTYTESALKNFGLNFYDKTNDEFIILSNAVPYIITYKSTSPQTKTTNIKYNWIQLQNYKVVTNSKTTLYQVTPQEIGKQHLESSYHQYLPKTFKTEKEWVALFKIIEVKTNTIYVYVLYDSVEKKFYLALPKSINVDKTYIKE